MNDKRLNAQTNNHEQLTNQDKVFQELREIKSEIKEVKKFLIINSLRHLVNNYEKITQAKQKKLTKDWKLAEKDEIRKKEIMEWDRIQKEDEEVSQKLSNGNN